MPPNIITPSRLETQLTGFALAAERTLRGVTYRAEIWGGEPIPRMFKDYRRVSYLNANTTLIQLANTLTRHFNQLHRK